MGKTKVQTQNSDKAPPTQKADLSPLTPDKQDSPVMQKPEKVAKMDEGVGSAQRAQAMTQLQRSVGNTRAARLADADDKAPPIQRKYDNQAEQPNTSPDVQMALNDRGRGEALKPVTRASMEKSFGADLSRVRVHDDPQANRAASDLRAQAFATGQDVYFASGNYKPETPAGHRLLAHELAHTVQQKDNTNTTNRATADDQPTTARAEDQTKAAAQSERENGTAARKAAPPLNVSQPGDKAEREAESAANQISKGKKVASGTLSPMRTDQQKPPVDKADDDKQPSITRQANTPDEAAQKAKEAQAPAIARASQSTDASAVPPDGDTLGKPIPLDSGQFTLPESQAAAIGRKGEVPVSWGGKLASGTLKIRKRGDSYSTDSKWHQPLALNLPALTPLVDAGIQPVLAVKINKGTVTGYVTVLGRKGGIGGKGGLMNAIKKHSRELGWAGININKLGDVKNEFSNGTLTLTAPEIGIKIGGFIDGTATLGLTNQTMTFKATGNIKIKGLDDAQLYIERDDKGVLSGKVEANVNIAKFSGKVNASFKGGIVDIMGTVDYTTEKLSGEVTLMITDEKTAKNLTKEQLGPEKIIESAQQAKQLDDESGAPKPGKRMLAGYGTLDFAFTEWLTGKAQVIIDGNGNVNVIGKIAPPKQIELFKEKPYRKDSPKLEIKAYYGLPVIGNINVFANIGLYAEAILGPGVIKDIEIEGTYSTDETVLNEFNISGTLNISAYAGVGLRAEGGAGLEIASHEIKAGVGINALAGVRGYVEAKPTVGYREKAAPEEGKKGEFYINGHLEMVAQPFLGLSGDLFVELDSPWWSPAPDKTWRWPIGSLEYPLPGQFGIGADVDYVLGSKEWPEIKFTKPDFNPSKFLTDMLGDHRNPKSKANQEKQGKWKEGNAQPRPIQAAGEKKGGDGVKAGGKGKPAAAKSKVQPGGAKKSKARPTDPKQVAEGERKKKELLKGGPKAVSKGEPAKSDKVKEQPKKEDPKEKAQREHDEKLAAGLRALDAVTQRYAKDGASKDEVVGGVKSVRRKFKVFKTIEVTDGGQTWDYEYVASPGKNKVGPPKKSNSEIPSQRKLPKGYDVRKKLYIRGSGWGSVRKQILKRDSAKIKKRLASIVADWHNGQQTRAEKRLQIMINDGKANEDAKALFQIRKQASIDKHIDTYIKNTKWHVDHIRALAEHWHKWGHNSSDDARWNATIDEENLNMVTEQYNLKFGSEGTSGKRYHYVDRFYVGPKFISQYASRGKGDNWDTKIDGKKFG